MFIVYSIYILRYDKIRWFFSPFENTTTILFYVVSFEWAYDMM